MYYIQNPKRQFKEVLKAKKEKKRNEKNLNPPEGFCITFRIPKRNSKKVWKPKKKRNEKNLSPPEGICIRFRIPKGNWKKVWKPKKERKEMSRIYVHLKDFVLHSESQKAIQRSFESQKRKEKKWEEFKSTWRILYYIQNPKRQFKEGLKVKKRKKRNEKNLNQPEGFYILFSIPKGNSKKIWKPKKERKEMRRI